MNGVVAQWLEHLLCKQDVEGSSPFDSTIFLMVSERDGCDQTKILTRRHEYGEAARNAGEREWEPEGLPMPNRGPRKVAVPRSGGLRPVAERQATFWGRRAYSSVG